ncbi:TonB-dependent receptor domain-containing protein [Kiloniella sp.]|uniref:TonB-dependent receptor domain-containing protein n=1 Tax=Kiloniella sp. TaxID=1938587 RepID=UPI003A912469
MQTRPKLVSEHLFDFSQSNLKGLLLGTAALIALPSGVVAQEVKKDPLIIESEVVNHDQDILLDPVYIDGKADVLTGGVQVGQEALERINPQDIKDVFRQEPGVAVSSPIAIGQKVYVNGIEDTKLAVDVDGARQVTKTFHHIGTAIIDPELLKAVKVETGVAPADAGPEALGGSISYETKDGRDFLDIDEAFGGYGKLTFNSNTGGFSENMALAAQYNNFDVLVYGSNDSGDNYSDGKGHEVAGTKPEMQSGLLKVGYSADNGYRVKLTGGFTKDDGIRPVRANFGGSSNPSDVPQRVDYERKSFSLSIGDETPTDLWDPRFSLSYTDTSLFADIKNTPIGEGIVSDITTINGKASNTFTTGLGKITSGADFYIDRGKGGRENDANYKEEVYDIGVFTQARLSLTDEARVSFGGRFDYNHLEGNEGTTLDNAGLSGNFSGEYDVTPWLMGYAGAGTAWGGVPMTEIGVQNYWSAFGVRWNYDDLAPSRSFNYKAGFVVEEGNFTFDGNVFYTKIDDSHDVSNSNRGTQNDVVSKGVNASAKYSFGDGFVRGSYSKTHVRVDGDVPVSTLAYQGILMGDTYGLEAGYSWPDLGLRAGATGEGALENDDTKKNGGNALDSYFVAGLYAEWYPEDIDGLSLRVDVKNLFDKDYVDRANVGYDSSRYTPYGDPGRTFLLAAKYEF